MTTGLVSDRLARLGIELPDVPAPVAAYASAVRVGSLVFTAGQLPMRDGRLMATGLVGTSATAGEQFVDPGLAVECARACAINALAAAAAVVGDLDSLASVVKTNVFVASAPGFFEQAAVADGCSELLREVFGRAHARSAVGVASLPLNAPVELDLVLEISERP